MSTERLNKSSDRIKESRRTMLETEELGVSILQDLSSQRQSLLHAHDTVKSYFICWASFLICVSHHINFPSTFLIYSLLSFILSSGRVFVLLLLVSCIISIPSPVAHHVEFIYISGLRLSCGYVCINCYFHVISRKKSVL